jgi:NAD(P)-dependent dehydrogenase (short-subunit alcohol dehydrogenase family)
VAYQPFNLAGKVALITGGNGGIGLGMAEALAQAGADICVWGTNPAKNAAARERLRAHGTGVLALECDVGDEAAVEAAFAATLAQFGRVDACFANAGISSGKATPFPEFTAEDWHRVLRVNLDGAFYTLRAAARHMKARAEAGDPGGRLVGTASLAAIEGAARNEHYAATKGGLVSMIRALAVELARYGITANSILPGWIETEMTAKSVANPKFAGNVLPRVPMRRWGTPEDFGGIAVYLTSDASRFHTGDSLLLDGGYALF